MKTLLKKKLTSRIILMIACILILAGYVLMSGPGSTENVFNPDIFSVRRIVIAPLLCLSGYMLIIVGILRYKSVTDDA
jgi:uncharacterized membrane protein YidH (DUF202 family)